jgi:hypothetical protein
MKNSLSRWRERVGVRVMGVQPIEDASQNCVALDQHLAVCEAKDVKAKAAQLDRAPSVCLGSGAFEVLPAIELDDESGFDAGKVCEVRTDRTLTAEFVAAKRSIA